MPIERQPNILPEVSPENEPFVFSPDQMRDALALQIVNQTFSTYETYRTSNHDRRWTECDALYVGYIPAKVWEGTTIPRANLPVQITFDQIESAYPSIMQALFSDEEWFQVVAEPGTSAKEALKIQQAMQYMLEHSKNDFGMSVVPEFGMAIRDLLKYGNGGVWLDWNVAKKRPSISWVDLRDIYMDPACPTPNSDENRAVIRRRMMTVQEISDLRGDPRMKVPDDEILWFMAKAAPSVSADSTRQSQEALRSVAFNPSQANYIPNPVDRKIEVLMYYSASQIVWVLNRQHVIYNEANNYGFIPCAFAPCYPVNGRFYAVGIAEAQRGNQRMIEGLLNGHLDEVSLGIHPPRLQNRASQTTNGQRKWGPGFTFSVDSKDDISLLQPQQVTTNVVNDIEFIMNLADKRTGIGAMAQGMPRPGNANRTATGMSLQSQGAANRLQPIVENIENFMLVPILRKMYKMMAYHLSIYDKVPVKRLSQTEEQRDGLPAQLAPQMGQPPMQPPQMGMPPMGQPGMPPGMPPQMAPGAPQSQFPMMPGQQPFPMRNPLLDPEEEAEQAPAFEPPKPAEAREEEGEIEWIGGWLFQRPCDFKMYAASKMLSKSNLMQIFPFITQYLLSGPLIEALKANGQAIDFSELLRMLQDAAGTEGRYDLIRPMTPQEQQKAQQPPPQLQQEQQMAVMKHQNSKEIMGMKLQAELQKTMMDKQESPQEMQMKMAESQQKMQLEQFKAQMAAALQQQKLEFERQMGELKLAMEHKKSQVAAQSAEQKMILDQQVQQTKMQMEQDRAATQLQTALIGNQQQLRHAEESHQMGLRQSEQMGQRKQMFASSNSAGSSKSGASEPRKKAEVRKKVR